MTRSRAKFGASLSSRLSTMDPFSLTTGIISLVTLAIKLVVGAVGLIDKTTVAHREAANELQDLLRHLERLERQMVQIHDKLQFLAADTKDRALKNLLQEYHSGQLDIFNTENVMENVVENVT